MSRQSISFDDLAIRPHHLLSSQWLLLTCGDFSAGDFNTMTIAWGSLGTMWTRPFAQVVVRHSRYTYTFMNRYDTFTLSAFPERYRSALQLLGSKSGRDSDKIAESGLTPVATEAVAAPTFAEASLVIACRKIYWQDMAPEHFLAPWIKDQYPNQDYHRIYFGEVRHIAGEAAFKASRET